MIESISTFKSVSSKNFSKAFARITKPGGTKISARVISPSEAPLPPASITSFLPIFLKSRRSSIIVSILAVFHIFLKSTKNFSGFGERAKNGGVLGEEIFCPRADFSDFVPARPASWRGGAVLGVFYKIGSNFVVKIRNDKTFFFFPDEIVGGRKGRPAFLCGGNTSALGGPAAPPRF